MKQEADEGMEELRERIMGIVERNRRNTDVTLNKTMISLKTNHIL